jgi:hypothetical protein
MKYYKKTILVLVLTSIVLFSKAQLEITGLKENRVVKRYLSEHKNITKASKGIDTLTLPFFDDFSTSTVFPSSELWLDSCVFINNSFGKNPPSFGVASFDAIGSDGLLYSNSNSTQFIADYLTSKPIDLSMYSPSDSLCLSFYYQPQGYFYDNPDESDSLVLEFATSDTNWTSVWRAAGTINQGFYNVFIPITEQKYFVNSFQFGFKNYASLGDLIEPSRKANCDIWNIDFVYLDTGRTENMILEHEVAMMYLMNDTSSLIQGYENVPWKHFLNNNIPTNSTLYHSYKNLGQYVETIDSYYQIIDVRNEDTLSTNSITSENISPNTIHTALDPTLGNGYFTSTSTDSALFEIRGYINHSTSLTDYFRKNDTLSYFQEFYNYYAYDDGTAEAGIGVYGTQSNYGKFSMKYYTYQPDTLRAVQIFFNHTKAIDQYFDLVVWDNDNGYPGDELYRMSGVLAKHDGINTFNNYKLDDIIIVEDTFFVGWQKTGTVEMMSVGLDLNRNARTNTYYSINGTSWAISPIDGAPMIRPVFGGELPLSDNIVFSENNKLELYPNPSSDIINIRYPENIIGSEINISIYDNLGRVVKPLTNNTNKIDINNLVNGIYILKVTDNKNYNAVKRFIVAK